SITNTATNTADSSTGIISKEDSFVSSIYGKINGLIGEFVWNDLNGNGIYDFNEPGINEVTVELYDETGTSLLQTTTTANRSSKAGFYFFPNVSVGKYLVKFIPPAGYALTVQNLVHNGSTPNQTTGFTNLITLAENQVDLYINAGVIEENNSEIGEFVWDDLNANGVYDPGEPGVNGVTVELYDSDGITLLATTTTANNNLNQPGYYNFANLAAGTYKVKFIPPVGYTLTNQNLGPNGSTPDPVTGFTNDITLAINQVNTTINAGILQPCLPPIINTTVYFVPLNSIYDPMLGVTAFDCQGTNITSSVIVTQNTVNTAIAGQYTVSYKVTDYRGQTTTKTITVTVYATSSYEQAISDLIESVALEQTGISHI
ncbi:MAG: SdrD B-like domain-containing protein, partial [Clostridia bacterium]